MSTLTLAQQVAFAAADDKNKGGGGSKNPLDGVQPDLSAFGPAFNSKVALVLGGLWALVLIGIAAYFLVAALKYARAKRRGHDDDLGEGAQHLKGSAIAFGIAVGASTILGGIMAVFS